MARENGVHTRKLVAEKLAEGIKYCGRCKQWKNILGFRMDHQSLESIHRWCELCEKEYLKEYHLRNKYGPNYEQLYREDKIKLFDINGDKWDSEDEVNITNWLIHRGIKFEKGPYYKHVFSNVDNKSKLKFDWKVIIDEKEYLVEYFGLWDSSAVNGRLAKYTKKAKKKIKLMFKSEMFSQFIIIFPNDLKTKKLKNIFQIPE
jgi:hypothetical protein